MIKYLLSISLILVSHLASGSCIRHASGISPASAKVISTISAQVKRAVSRMATTPALPVPKGYKITGRIGGDLNSDGIPDSVLILKATLKDRLENNGDGKTVDRNRRGLIVFLGMNGQFKKVTENLNCFSSENEDGGVYFPPELSVEIGRNKLYVHYRHGRYGYWKYTFRLRGSDFELIGYDASNNTGPRIDRQVSINFLTKKRMERINTNASAEGGDEVFEEKSNDISLEGLARLSQIENFDNLEEGGW
ncbi:hypothetical protein ACFOTA_00980 [Chitinophaga sp. GCM10012297]|uniref:Uncharacterized protein n=1 Tax=Chitinophaga chungangae TaxID=2821488 RepID=A0ABS3Y7W2_9BACT|nr:hypothetical protein [Chitinophaga chungangae]MBO9150765.1 hypothetical protein [Chitinophaga chungangae]